MSSKIVQVEKLGKSYRIYKNPKDRFFEIYFRNPEKQNAFWALRNISFEIGRGETMGVIGRNGSGKSTLLHILAGTLLPTEGTAEVRGRRSALLELGSGFNAQLTGRENIWVNGAILGLSRQEIQKKLVSIVDFSGLEEFIDRPVKTYSSGMVVRLAFSIASSIEPEVLLIDEALSVGDAGFQIRCIDRIERLTQSGTTLLLVTHDLKIVRAYCQKALYLNQGKAAFLGSASEAVERYQSDIKENLALWQGRTVERKAACNSHSERKAFGTLSASILSCSFEDGQAQRVAAPGELVRFSLDAQFDASIRNPVVSFLITDHRKITLGGQSIEIRADHIAGQAGRVRVTAQWNPQLSPGQYFIAGRLEDRRSAQLWEPLEKQDALLSLHIIPSGAEECFLGPAQLGISLQSESVPREPKTS